MCGIFGWLGPNIDHERALGMRDRLSHRGPDGAGHWYDADAAVWLGQRRLAILDLSLQGHQPMRSPCGRYVLTYNGEIYNYKALRSELEVSGYCFLGESDTEVLLAACIIWGIESAVKRFEGMFAFGLYDRIERALWLVRDPMGIKPLYYAHDGQRFAFSSELTVLLQLPWLDRSIDQDALFAYFRYGCIPAPASILNGVRKLSSGALLYFKQGKVQNKQFWNLANKAATLHAGRDADISLSEAADALDARLRDSVRLHMHSDVPYGAFLSGGVDSSTVVALMQAQSSLPVKTFSIGFAEASHDEAAHARAVAKHLGTEHHELVLNSRDIPALVPDIAGIFDEPFADNSSVPTYLVSRFARESVTVCLSGDGGDELFGGYPRYFWATRIESVRRRLRPAGRRLAAKVLQAFPKTFWDQVVDPLIGYRYSSSEGLAYRVNRLAAYLGVDRQSAYAETMSIWREPAELLGFTSDTALGVDAMHFSELPWAEEMMLIDQSNYLQDDILTKVDRASMAVSLEARVPLLSHPMVEYSWQLPARVKLAEHGDRGKLVLREVLYRYVPKSIIERPKQGFGMPVGKWLRGPLRTWAESLLSSTGLETCGLRPQAVLKIWHEHQQGHDRQAMLWAVLMYRLWHQRVFGS